MLQPATKESTTRVEIPVPWDNVGITVQLLGRFPAESGDIFVRDALRRQTSQPTFIEAFGEPSARLIQPTVESPVAVYSFGIEECDMVPHYHVGPRVITAVSRSSGVELLFGTTPPCEVAVRPQAFFEGLHLVQVPGDSLFMMSFRSAWHSFRPKGPGRKAMFALSVHSDELFGLTAGERKAVLEVGASIPLLTRPAPDAVLAMLGKNDVFADCNRVVLAW